MTTGPSAPTPSEPPTREAGRIMVLTWVGSAIATVVVAIVLGIVVDPWLYTVALFAIVDLLIARRYATASAAADPSYNPYARED